MSRRGSSALEVWTQIPVASRTVEVNTKTGFTAAPTSGSIVSGSFAAGAIDAAAIAADAIGASEFAQAAADKVWSTTTRAITANNDKTGYSLTAGSYVVRASSTQIGSTNSAAASVTATISSVTTTRAMLDKNGQQANNTSIVECDTGVEITNATTVTVYKTNATGATITSFMVMELF